MLADRRSADRKWLGEGLDGYVAGRQVENESRGRVTLRARRYHGAGRVSRGGRIRGSS
jgi:hypothetical protein